MKTEVQNEVVCPDNIWSGSELDAISDAIVEYITDKTGFCIASLSYSIDVSFMLDDEDDAESEEEE